MCSNKSIFTPHPTVSLCLPVKEKSPPNRGRDRGKGLSSDKGSHKENPLLMGDRDRDEGLSLDKGSQQRESSSPPPLFMGDRYRGEGLKRIPPPPFVGDRNRGEGRLVFRKRFSTKRILHPPLMGDTVETEAMPCLYIKVLNKENPPPPSWEIETEVMACLQIKVLNKENAP